MDVQTRKILDRSFSMIGIVGIIMMGASLVVLLGPIVIRGTRAFIFKGTVEYRELMLNKFGRGDRQEINAEVKEAESARRSVYRLIDHFDEELEERGYQFRREYQSQFDEIEQLVEKLLGPRAGERMPVLIRDQYGQTRWDRARAIIADITHYTDYDYSDPSRMGVEVRKSRQDKFAGTTLEPLFGLIEKKAEEMLRPRLTFYWRFLFDKSFDAHFFGGIWPEVLGTFYLSLGAMIFAVPFGVVAAIYLAEYAGESRFVSLLRTCITSLAGVPSIVFGLFGLAFFINTVHISQSKSVIAGSATLALLILPTIIRASEEAIRSVPTTYREAAMSLGAGKWHTVVTVILPAALPGILTSIIISMGRAAGETAPIIFTAAVSVGKPLGFSQVFSQPTPALPWNIYNLATEHEAVNEIRHVQYGMVLTLVVMVMLLNLAAIILRARITRKLRT